MEKILISSFTLSQKSLIFGKIHVVFHGVFMVAETFPWLNMGSFLHNKFRWWAEEMLFQYSV